MKIARYFALISLVVVALTSVAALAASGPQQAWFPRLNGWSKIATGIYTDAPDRAAEFVALVEASQAPVEDFFGQVVLPKRIVLCGSERCARRLIRGARLPRGLAYGRALIIIAPDGLGEMIIAHELVHATFAKVAGRRVPTWFNEGLASYLSNDTRLSSADQEALLRIKAAQRSRDWNRLVPNLGWQIAYGGARDLVAELFDRHVQDALRRLVFESRDREDFSNRYEALVADLRDTEASQ